MFSTGSSFQLELVASEFLDNDSCESLLVQVMSTVPSERPSTARITSRCAEIDFSLTSRQRKGQTFLHIIEQETGGIR